MNVHMPGTSPHVPSHAPCDDCTATGDIHYLPTGERVFIVRHDDTCPRLRALHQHHQG